MISMVVNKKCIVNVGASTMLFDGYLNPFMQLKFNISVSNFQNKTLYESEVFKI